MSIASNHKTFDQIFYFAISFGLGAKSEVGFWRQIHELEKLMNSKVVSLLLCLNFSLYMQVCVCLFTWHSIWFDVYIFVLFSITYYMFRLSVLILSCYICDLELATLDSYMFESHSEKTFFFQSIFLMFELPSFFDIHL